MITFSLNLLIRVTLVLAIAMLGGWFLGRRRATIKHHVYSLALTAAVLAPIFMTYFPSIDILPAHALHVNEQPVDALQSTATQSLTDVSEIAQAPADLGMVETSTVFAAHDAAVPWISTERLLWIWAVGTFVMLSPLLLGRITLYRLKRQSRIVSSGGLVKVATEAARELGVNHRVELRISGRSVMPMCWGLFHPTILLQSEAADWSQERQHRVLLHELGHIQRRDLWTDLIAQVARACYWFHPLFWIARRQLVRLREVACDDLVLSTGLNVGNYAEDLLMIAERSRENTRGFAAGMSMAGRSGLAYRLRTILEPGMIRTVKTSLGGRFCVALFALLTVVTFMLGNQHGVVLAESDGATAESQNGSVRVTSDDGFTVEMIAVGCEDDSPSWWTPSGEPLPNQLHKGPEEPLTISGGRPVQFVMKLTNVGPSDKVIMRVPELDYTSLWTKTLEGDAARVYYVPMPADQKTAQFQVQRSSGPWESRIQIKSRTMQVSSSGDISLVVSAPTGDAKQSTIHASIGIDGYQHDHRLVAIDTDGQRHQSGGLYTMSANGKNRAAISVAHFKGLPVDRYAGVELQIRPYTKQIISNISLKPGERTKPSVSSKH